MKNRILSLMASILVLLVVTGCGGKGKEAAAPAAAPVSDSGSSFPTVNAGAGGPQDALMFFYGAGISAVDPPDPTVPITVDSGGHPVAAIPQGVFDAGRQRVSDFRVQTLIYERGGKLYRVGALNSEPLAPVQLSMETKADTIVGKPEIAADYADAGNSQLVYQLADGSWQMVRAGMTSSDSPVPARRPLAPVYDDDTGAIAGWLAVEGAQVKRFDSGFNAGSAVAVTSFANDVSVIDATLTRIFLLVDGRLHAYETVSGTLSEPLYTFKTVTSGNRIYTKDGNHLYFTEGGSLWRVSLTGGPVEPVAAETGTIVQLSCTGKMVLYVVQDGDRFRLVARDKAALAGATELAAAAAGDVLLFIGARGDRVFYDKVLSSGTTVAGMVMDDGSNREEGIGSFWIGGSSDPVLDFNAAPVPRFFVRADGIASIISFNGGQLLGVNAITGDGVILGMVPGDMDVMGIFAGVSGSRILLEGGKMTGISGFASDIFFADLERGESLTRVTSTAGSSEHVISILR